MKSENRKKIYILSFTGAGAELGLKLYNALNAIGMDVSAYTYDKFIKDERQNSIQGAGGLNTLLESVFDSAYALIFTGAAGIAVRAVAGLIRDKFTDPAVLCMDEGGRYIIPLLSGHAGGANELAKRISLISGAEPVITTATDVRGLWAVDVWALDNSLHISDRSMVKEISAALLAGERIGMFTDFEIKGNIPEEILIGERCRLNVRVSPFIQDGEDMLNLISKNVCIGIGCRRNTSIEDMREAIDSWLSENSLDIHSISHVASIDIKADEPAVRFAAEYLGAENIFFSREELMRAEGDFTESGFVLETVGVGNVCERAAKLVYGKLLARKRTYPGISIAASLNTALRLRI